MCLAVCVWLQVDDRRSGGKGKFKCQVCRLQFASIDVSYQRLLFYVYSLLSSIVIIVTINIRGSPVQMVHLCKMLMF